MLMICRDKKLTKTQIYTTDIPESVENILSPDNQLALRVSGQLMLGVARIYSRKVKYLMSDCTEAMWKIKLVCFSYCFLLLYDS